MQKFQDQVHPTVSTTPSDISPAILELCKRIGIARSPIFVPVRPAVGTRPNYCFQNVGAKIAADGGSIQHGWIIWERPGVLVEGEFHACWVSPDKELIDITPKPDGEYSILFLPDEVRKWRGVPMQNVRMPLANNNYVRQVIAETEYSEKIRQRDWSRVGRNDLCLCGSGKKFKKCCGFYTP